MMKKTLFCGICLVMTITVFAQHYYKDILVLEASNQRHKLNRQNKVSSIKFVSFDADNNPIEGFSSEQKFNRDHSEINTRTSTTLTGATLSTSWYNSKDQLIKTQDTSDGSKTVVTYTYAADGRLQSLENITTSAGDFMIREIHQWTYNAQGKPTKMLKIKNNKDTTYIEYVLDEKGNPAEEKSMFKKQALPTVFYYYDDDNLLTDIVRYNIAAKRLLPDYVFEYDEKNRVGSMLVVPEEGSDYQKWYYSYDDDGLKILDACYSKTKTLIARVEYQYTYY